MLGCAKILRNLTRNYCSGSRKSTPEHMSSNREYLIWIDLEMTGLDVEKDKIIEVACIITNSELKPVHQGLHFVIHHPEHVLLNECSEWSKVQHKKTGLIDDSIKSTVLLEVGEKMLFEYIKDNTNHDINPGRNFLAGNSVYMDKRFLEKYMPKVNQLLHYRIIDVSTIKELCSMWYPVKFNTIQKETSGHRALSDIKASIEELKTYRTNFFI